MYLLHKPCIFFKLPILRNRIDLLREVARHLKQALLHALAMLFDPVGVGG